MAARKKSTKKTSGTAAPKQKLHPFRGRRESGVALPRRDRAKSEASLRLSRKRSSSSSKVRRKRIGGAAVSQSATTSLLKGGKRTSTKAKASAKANKSTSRARAKVSTASKSNSKRVEVKLPLKNDHKDESKVSNSSRAGAGFYDEACDG